MKAKVACEGQTFELASGDAITVGREKASCDLVVDEKYSFVSKVHGRFRLTEEGLLYDDLESTNGSYAQAGRLPPKRVEPGKPFPLSGKGVVWLGRPNLLGVGFEAISEKRTEEIGSIDVYELYRAAKRFMDASDYKRALGNFEKLLSIAPGAHDAYLEAAVCAANVGESEEALALAKSYLTVNPFDAEALGIAAEAARRCGKYDEALDHLRRASIISDPDKYNKEINELGDLAQISRGKSKEILDPSLKGRIEGPNFTLEYILSEHGRIQTDVVKAVELGQKKCEDLLGIVPSERVRIILKSHSHPLRSGEMRGGEIVLYASDQLCSDVSFLQRLTIHEYVHHVLTTFIDPENLPWWLNEGLAERISEGPLLEFEKVDIHDIMDEEDFYKPVVHQTHKRAGLARYLVLAIEERWGWEKIREILNRLANGEDCKKALEEAIGYPIKLLDDTED